MGDGVADGVGDAVADPVADGPAAPASRVASGSWSPTTAPTTSRNANAPATELTTGCRTAHARSRTHKAHPAGGSGHSAGGRHPGPGSHPAGGVGHTGGDAKRHLLPLGRSYGLVTGIPPRMCGPSSDLGGGSHSCRPRGPFPRNWWRTAAAGAGRPDR